MRDQTTGWFVFFKLMKTILATKSKLKNNLLVHQQLRRSRNGQHYQIAGNFRGNNYRPLLFVYLHNQVVTTALEPKGLSSGTKGKLVDKVRRLQIETIRSQVLTCLKKTVGMQFRDSMVMGYPTGGLR
jgi:hypothetical protein